jgi:DNA-binding CsgD family transcriptional regulator
MRGRDQEVTAVRDAVAAVAAGRGGIVLIQGLPGTGKSALLDEAVELAAPHGIRVARSSACAATATVPFAPILEALATGAEPVIDPGALRELSRSPEQRFWLLRELQDQLEYAALAGPVLIALDDLQWADEATLSAVATLPRQLASHRILWLLAFRDNDLTFAARSAVTRVAAAQARSLTLGALDDAAVAAVARDILGAPPDPALAAFLSGVRGQPFLLVELVHALSDEGVVAIDGGLARAAAGPISARFSDSVTRYLSSLSEAARDVARMSVVLGRRLSVEELAAFTGRPVAELVPLVEELLHAGVFAEDGQRLGFRHDLVREAIDASLPCSLRESMRRRAVEVMLRHGAQPADVAALVMEIAAPGDRAGIELLRRASAEIGRISPAVAAPLSRRALDLTPWDDPSRSAQILETIDMLVMAGKSAEASRLLSVAGQHLLEADLEAQARLGLAMSLMHYSPVDAIEQCRLGLRLSALPPALRMYLASVMSCGLDIAGDVPGAAAALRQALSDEAAAGLSRDWSVLIPQGLSALPHQQWQSALEASREAVRRQHLPGGMNARMWRPEAWQATVLLSVSCPREAMRLIDDGERLSAAEGVPGKARVWMMLRARALLDLGQLADALTEADAIFEMSDELGAGNRGYLNDVASWVAGCAALHTGDPRQVSIAESAARRLCRAQLAPSRVLGELLAAGLRDLAGQPHPTAGLTQPALDGLGSASLTASSPRSHADLIGLIRLLVADGRTAEAELLAAGLEAAAAAQPTFPLIGAAARHARALTEADADLAIQAADLHQHDQRTLVRAGALEDAGRLLPACRRDDAVGYLDAALGLYAAAGADQDAARVRGLLRSAGVRRSRTRPQTDRQWPELTDSEEAVTALVAEGATNREVAERLFVSPYTVNSHLRHIFGKLGIRSRVELARLAAQRGGQNPDQEPRDSGVRSG